MREEFERRVHDLPERWITPNDEVVGTVPMLRHVFADGGYAGPKQRDVLKAIGRWTVQIAKRSDTVVGFEVPPRRWAVERIIASLGRCRRVSKTWENPSPEQRGRSPSPTFDASHALSQGIYNI